MFESFLKNKNFKLNYGFDFILVFKKINILGILVYFSF